MKFAFPPESVSTCVLANGVFARYSRTSSARERSGEIEGVGSVILTEAACGLVYFLDYR